MGNEKKVDDERDLMIDAVRRLIVEQTETAHQRRNVVVVDRELSVVAWAEHIQGTHSVVPWRGPILSDGKSLSVSREQWERFKALGDRAFEEYARRFGGGT